MGSEDGSASQQGATGQPQADVRAAGAAGDLARLPLIAKPLHSSSQSHHSSHKAATHVGLLERQDNGYEAPGPRAAAGTLSLVFVVLR